MGKRESKTPGSQVHAAAPLELLGVAGYRRRQREERPDRRVGGERTRDGGGAGADRAGSLPGLLDCRGRSVTIRETSSAATWSPGGGPGPPGSLRNAGRAWCGRCWPRVRAGSERHPLGVRRPLTRPSGQRTSWDSLVAGEGDGLGSDFPDYRRCPGKLAAGSEFLGFWRPQLGSAGRGRAAHPDPPAGAGFVQGTGGVTATKSDRWAPIRAAAAGGVPRISSRAGKFWSRHAIPEHREQLTVR